MEIMAETLWAILVGPIALMLLVCAFVWILYLLYIAGEKIMIQIDRLRALRDARASLKRKKAVAPPHGDADRLNGPRAVVSLSCGAKVVKLEPHDVDNTSIAEFDAQPEAVRKGGFFFQCHARCPYMFDCPRQKALSRFGFGEHVRVPLEDGLFLELQRHDGHRSVAVVGKPNEEFEPVALAGVTFTNGGKRYTTVPPLMQKVEEPDKDIK